MLLGRRTFEDFRSYWPKQATDRTGITDYLNGVAKYVVSSTMTNPGWANSTVLRGDAIEAVRELKPGPGRDIVVTGSITLTHALVSAGLVDEYRFFVYPTFRAGAAPLVRRVWWCRGWNRRGRRRCSGHGVVLLRYRPA